MNNIKVDTKSVLVLCRMLNTPTTIEACAVCEHHGGIMEVWPGKDGEAIDNLPLDRVSLEAYQDKPRQYDVYCAKPVRIRAIYLVERIKE